MKINELTKMSICIAIICISAYISFPLPFSPVMITAQTIAINLVALILTPKQSFIVTLLYIILGVFGLPVFSGGTSGFGRVFGPTGGFILGFLIITPLMSYFKGKDYNFKRYLSVTIIIGMIVLYAFGAVFMSVVQSISIVQALSLAVFPFVVGDVSKCFLSSFIAVKLNKVINK